MRAEDFTDIQFRKLYGYELQNLINNAKVNSSSVILFCSVPFVSVTILEVILSFKYTFDISWLIPEVILFIFVLLSFLAAKDNDKINKCMSNGDCSCCKFNIVSRKVWRSRNKVGHNYAQKKHIKIEAVPADCSSNKVVEFGEFDIRGTFRELESIDSFYVVRFGTDLYRAYLEQDLGAGV